MKIHSTHSLNQKLKSLSGRLQYLTSNDNDTYANHVDTKVISENLKYNTSLLLAHIIINLEFIDRNEKSFLDVISNYNKANKTSLTLKHFEDLCWVRIINKEVLIPRVIRSRLYTRVLNKSSSPPGDNEDLMKCLQIYHEKYFYDAKLFISKEKLEGLILQNSSNQLDIDFLIDRKILGFDSAENKYYWKGSEYVRYLRKEISATVWILIGNAGIPEAAFRKYIKLLKGAGVWLDDLENYLVRTEKERILKLAIVVLNSEPDLLKSESEFTKIWLDSAAYAHVDFYPKIPKVEFNYHSTYDFVEDINFNKWRFPAIFDYEETRSVFLIILRLVVNLDSKQQLPYENVLRILKDTSKPYLVWTLYQIIPREFPEVIPYLISDPELTPLAFRLLDKTSIKSVLLSEQSNNDKQYEEHCKVIGDMWLEMFDITLDQLEISTLEAVSGEIVGKVLIDTSKNVFNANVTNKQGITKHNSFRTRYDEVLKRISNKRYERGINHSSYVTPRILFQLVPSIFSYLKVYHAKLECSHLEFLKLNTAFVDLAIEMLKLLNTEPSNFEISDEQRKVIKKTSDEIVKLLASHIENYFAIVDVKVWSHDSSEAETKIAKRGVNEFGVEIINWGYLYLHLQKSGLITTIDQAFKSALVFDQNEDRYHDQNKEQFEKIKLYVKFMMLAYVTIDKSRSMYEIDSFPVKETLIKLEELIKHYVLSYSGNDPTEKRINFLDERFSYITYDIYHQSLISLLYRCINLFEIKSEDFTRDFFNNSVDVGKMLTAINIFDSKELQKIVSVKLNSVKIEDFIEDSFTINELEGALIEAINSEDHWQLAEPLLNRIQKHFEKAQFPQDYSKNFLFEVSLLLAFKRKDMEKLKEIAIPKNTLNSYDSHQKNENLKTFYSALFQVYNSREYDLGIQQLEALLSKEPKNIRYAFQLYRARTLKAISK